jgi:hypothetical protein
MFLLFIEMLYTDEEKEEGSKEREREQCSPVEELERWILVEAERWCRETVLVEAKQGIIWQVSGESGRRRSRESGRRRRSRESARSRSRGTTGRERRGRRDAKHAECTLGLGGERITSVFGVHAELSVVTEVRRGEIAVLVDVRVLLVGVVVVATPIVVVAVVVAGALLVVVVVVAVEGWS